ncbi:MAG: TetR/AcrR family transcriptional regulator, cholesterol catabolism regulator [Acidobacteriota bacterium]|jgi:AcrR family transcriptional regulator|nr:TetR/AcrR family transcriptional regulator, cholesterol catabolism regulator [Acidobacteriota bacterium]
MSASLSEKFTRYDQKLEFILRTAARIFAGKGYHSTTMRDISRETQVSLAGLYHYCRSKEELLFLIQDNCFGRVLERLLERLEETTEPVEKLRLVIENHLSFFAANMAEMKVLSHEADSLAGEMHEHVSGKKQQYTQLVRRILSEVQQARASGGQEIDLTVATYALFGMMNWIYNWYDPNGKLSVNELVENVTRLFLSGFFAGMSGEELQFRPKTNEAERLSVWRVPQN